MAEALLIATHNSHKTEEMRDILGDLFSEIEDLTSLPDLTPPEETGTTFAENAVIKALAASMIRPTRFILADDSGLEVDALGGAPGVYSARYAGPAATDADNRAKLLQELGGVPAAARTARFRCALAIARSGTVLAQFDGTVEGLIASGATGAGGFGYDPIFCPEGYTESFGQLPSTVKNALSHRGRALEKFREWVERARG
jgi:XTP/dITP diphosphohydrolase